jgi:hypothetical protein
VPPPEVIEGGCLYGAVRYRVVGAPDLVPIRHHIWLRSKRLWMHEPADVERLEKGLGGPRMPTQG